MLYILPTTFGVVIPSTIMEKIAVQIDPSPEILWGNEATPEAGRTAILAHNPPYVFTTGHGLPCVTTVQDKEPFISLKEPQMSSWCKEGRNMDIVKGRIWHVHSCWCGRELALVMVNKGARAVFAEDNEYMFLIPHNNKIDIITAAPFLAEYTTDATMLSGGTVREAQAARITEYSKWVKYFQAGEGSKLQGAGLAARVVLADKMIASVHGDTSATIPGARGRSTFRLNLPISVGGSGSGIALLGLCAVVALAIKTGRRRA